jgi:hypothetical protein
MFIFSETQCQQSMKRMLNTLLGVAVLAHEIVWYLGVQNWLVSEKEMYAITSAFVVLTFSFKYFLTSKIGPKNNLLLMIIVLHLLFTNGASYNVEGLSHIPLIILTCSILLLILEVYDWIKGKPKHQKMNLIQLVCFISFLFWLIFRLLHHPGLIIPFMLFHVSLIGIAIDLMTNKRYLMDKVK